MDNKEFKKFVEEMIPLIEKMTEVARKYNPDNKLISATCSADGYFDLSNHRFSGNACRIASDGTVTISEWKEAKDVPV